jgi:hypothetical protein
VDDHDARVAAHVGKSVDPFEHLETAGCVLDEQVLQVDVDQRGALRLQLELQHVHP